MVYLCRPGQGGNVVVSFCFFCSLHWGGYLPIELAIRQWETLGFQMLFQLARSKDSQTPQPALELASCSLRVLFWRVAFVPLGNLPYLSFSARN